MSVTVTAERKPEETSLVERTCARRGLLEPSSHQARIVSSAVPFESITLPSIGIDASPGRDDAEAADELPEPFCWLDTKLDHQELSVSREFSKCL